MHHLYFLVLPLVISFLTTPLLSLVARKNGLMDKPGLHKTHHEAKPLLGGLSIFLAVIVSVFVLLPDSSAVLSLMGGGAILVIVGLLDDIYNLNPYVKLAGQLAAAILVVLCNHASFSVLVEFTRRFYLPKPLTLLFIIGWLVLMINAFNLIDGLDGLACGTAVIIFAAMTVVSSLHGRGTMTALLLIGLGACLGFLPYNFNPARIFMGDTGSMLLGYLLGVIHLFVITAPFDVSLVLGTMFIMAYPATDVCFAIFRRIKNKTSIFKADQGHIHHLLLRLGLRVREVVLLIYAIDLFFASLAVYLLCASVRPLYVIILGIIMIAVVCALLVYLRRASAAKMNCSGEQRLSRVE